MEQSSALREKLQKHIEQYVYDADLSSPEALNGIINLVRSYPEVVTEEQIKEQLRVKFDEALGHDGVDGTYIYCLTRVKEAFHVGTMTLDDFVEVDAEFTENMVDVAMEQIRTFQQQNKQLIDKLKWIKLHSNERHIVQRAVAALQQIQGKDEEDNGI